MPRCLSDWSAVRAACAAFFESKPRRRSCEPLPSGRARPTTKKHLPDASRLIDPCAAMAALQSRGLSEMLPVSLLLRHSCSARKSSCREATDLVHRLISDWTARANTTRHESAQRTSVDRLVLEQPSVPGRELRLHFRPVDAEPVSEHCRRATTIGHAGDPVRRNRAVPERVFQRSMEGY
jgi:hypothetical protein